jgi:hypothetical protein
MMISCYESSINPFTPKLTQTNTNYEQALPIITGASIVNHKNKIIAKNTQSVSSSSLFVDFSLSQL